MMRFTHTIATGAGMLLVVPAVAGGGKVDSLRSALAETTRSIEILSGIAERVEGGDDDARRLLVRYTEPAEGAERERDERVFELRQDINHLQLRLDAIAAPGVAARREAGPTRPPGELPPADPSLDAEPGPTGLDADTLALLSEIHAPGAGRSTPEQPGTPRETRPPVVTPPVDLEPTEAPGYSADPLRQARACLQAGLHEKGLAVLSRAEDSPETSYWRGRLLEEAGRFDEAIEAYASVAAGDGPLAARAAELQGFLVWRRDFERSLTQGKEQRP